MAETLTTGDVPDKPKPKKPEASLANVRHALKVLEVKLSYDVFSEKTHVVYPTSNGDQILSDEHMVKTRLQIEDRLGLRIPKEYYKDVVKDLAFASKFHPVRDYLDTLVWDNTPRIDTWFATYGGAHDSPYMRAIGSIFLIAAVRRVRDPGCKYDELIVMESEQGWNKSTALRALCPRGEWFSDDLPLNVDSKELIEATLGKWIIEASELSGLRRGGVEHLKSLLSRQVDGPCRMAYAELPIERPRQFVVIGTTNNNQGYLPDYTGNRRFWPLPVQKFDVDQLERDRDQLWAEASKREAEGESARLHPDLYDEAGRQQEHRRQDDDWEPILDAAWPDRNATYRVTPEDIWTQLGTLEASGVGDTFVKKAVPIARRDPESTRRISMVMQFLSFRRMTVRRGDHVFKGWGRDAPR